jgi:hypothetical protein
LLPYKKYSGRGMIYSIVMTILHAIMVVMTEISSNRLSGTPQETKGFYNGLYISR